MRVSVVIPIVLVFLSCPCASRSAPADDVEERLVAAELAEVSAGDLQRALAAFQSLASDEKAPGSTRARALLGAARCQRKLGQLDAARKSLEDLIKTYAGDVDAVSRARGYLRELQGGKAENPDFDWIGEIERNPEVQARVFEWTMQLADGKNDVSAAKQLLALGVLSLPVIERVLDASRDAHHRQRLAIIAARIGRLDRLAVLLDPAEPADLSDARIREALLELLGRLPDSSAEARKKVLEVLARVPPSPRAAAIRAALAIAAGDLDGLEGKLKSIEGSILLSYTLIILAESGLDSAAALAARASDATATTEIRASYVYSMFEKAPDKIRPEHWDVLIESMSQREHIALDFLERLESLGRFDVLARLALGRAAHNTLEWFKERYVQRGNLAEAPGAWGAFLRGARSVPGGVSLEYLHRLAEVNDEAAGEFAAFLRAREQEKLDFKPSWKRLVDGWTPSPRYAELMASLLDSKDPVVLEIALEAVGRAPQGTGPDVLPALEQLAGSQTPPVAEAALAALIQRVSTRPETAGRAAKVLLDDWRGRQVQRNSSRIKAAFTSESYLNVFKEALALDLREEDAEFLAHLDALFVDDDALWVAIFSTLERLDKPGQRAVVLAQFGSYQQFRGSAQGLEFLRRVATDANLLPQLRALAISLAGEQGLAWVDLKKMFMSDLGLVVNFSPDWLGPWLSRQEAKEQDAFLEALARCPDPGPRWMRLHIYPRDRAEYAEVLLKALDDPDKNLQGLAVSLLLNNEKLRGSDLYARLLAHPVANRTQSLYARTADTADERLIEPLVKLLDEQDSAVRKLALDALKKIRSFLEEKKEWKVIVEALKERRKG